MTSRIGQRLGEERRGARGKRPVAGLLRVEAREHDHLRARGTAGAHARLDRHRLLQLEIDEDQIGRKVVAVHELQPGARAENEVEVGRVRFDPAAEAVEKHLVVVEQREPNPRNRGALALSAEPATSLVLIGEL